MKIKIPWTNIVLSLNAVDGKTNSPYVYGSRLGQYGSADMGNYKLSYDSLYSAYRNQGDIYACIREWRENVGAGGFKLVNPTDPETEVPEGLQTQVLDILNYWYPWRTFKGRVVRDLGVAGNAYAHITKAVQGDTVIGLQLIDPRTISIVCTEQGDIIKYIQKVGQKTVEFPPEEIIHFMIDSDPNHEIFGFSPMESVIWEARTDLSAMMANYYFFENQGLPAAYYILDENLSKESAKEATALISEQFKGTKNYNRSGVLQGVKEIKTLNISQKDMEFLGGREFTTGKICAAYGVPKFMLGYTEKTNYNNGDNLMKKFYKGTIQPIEEAFDEVINEFLVRIGLGSSVKFQTNPQIIDEQADIEERAMKELQGGAITLHQYKIKTGQEVTPEDETNPNFDEYIIYNGSSAVLLSDVGIDPMIGQENNATAQNLIHELKNFRHESKV